MMAEGSLSLRIMVFRVVAIVAPLLELGLCKDFPNLVELRHLACCRSCPDAPSWPLIDTLA